MLEAFCVFTANLTGEGISPVEGGRARLSRKVPTRKRGVEELADFSRHGGGRLDETGNQRGNHQVACQVVGSATTFGVCPGV